MPFVYTGAGGLFTRVGAAGGMLNSINALLGTGNLSAASIESLGSGIDNIASKYAAPDLNLIAGLYPARDTYRGIHTSMLSYLQALAQGTVVQQVNEFSALSALNLKTALTALIAQMKTDAQTVAKPTVSATVTPAGSNVGTGVLVASVLNPDGTQADYAVAETITATCTTDGQSGGTAGREVFTLTSPPAQTNALSWDWPQGSGLSSTLTAVDALVDNASGNLLQNGSFKTWTAPSIGPDNWLILDPGAGVGTTIVQASSTNVYKGTSGIGFVGDGIHVPSISQPFGAALSTAGNAGGSPATLSPLTQYCFNLFLKVSSVPAAGTLVIELTDGTNTVVNDAAGTPNSLSITLSGATTGFLAHNICFRTPAVTPATGYRLRIRLSAALSAASTVYFGHAALAASARPYAGGPSGSFFSGAANFIVNDAVRLVIANNYGSAWQKLADRLFGMRTLGLQLPSGGSPTILDTLIA